MVLELKFLLQFSNLFTSQLKLLKKSSNLSIDHQFLKEFVQKKNKILLLDQSIGYQIFWIRLFTTIDHIFWIC